MGVFFQLLHQPSCVFCKLQLGDVVGRRVPVGCLDDGRLDPAATLDFVARLPALADAAYAQGMRETTNDENLAVMYAQLLWMVHGKARARDALELYSKAVEFAPHDADTYRILGTETISMLGEVGEDGGSRW